MVDWRDLFPEADCIAGGDPFLTEIVKGDDIICDHRYNAELLGISPIEALRTVLWAERLQLDYELALLERWYRW